MITNTQTSYWSQKLREYRIANGITQKELADRCDISPLVVCRIETQRNSNIRTKTLHKLNAFFNELA